MLFPVYQFTLTLCRRSIFIAAALLASTNAMAMDFASPIQPTTGNGGGLGQLQIQGVTRVNLDATLLAQLPSKGQFTLLGFPIGNGQTVDLELEQFHVELADAHAVVSSVDANGEIISTPVFQLGDAVQFRGAIIGDQNSKAFLSFSSTANAGIIVTANGKTFIMSDGEVNSRGPIVITSMSELPPGVIQWSPFSCGVNTSDFMPGRELLDETPDSAIAKAVDGCQVAKIYIETDYQLYGKLGYSSTALTNYILQMAGAANSIYYKDMQIDLRLAGWFIYTNDAADGFGIYGDSYGALEAVQNKWQSPPYSGYDRTLVSYITSQGVGGGVAWLYALCEKDYGFSMCGNLAGAFPYPLSLRSAQNWDIMVFCHELGHNFGAYHTHDLGLDNCYTSSGLGSCVASNPNYPPIGGTIMSYCHQCPNGMSNINLIFHYGSVNDIAPYLQNNPCFGNCGSLSITASRDQREQVALSWTSDPNAQSYTVYRRLPTTITSQNPLDMALPVSLMTVTGLSTVDTTIECNKNYEYYVRANYTTSSTSSPTGMMSDIQRGIALCGNANMLGWGISTGGELNIPSIAAKAIAAGGNHSVALKNNGAVACWGNNSYGQALAPTMNNAVQVAAGYRHSGAVLADGNIQLWGAGKTNTNIAPNYGQSIVPSSATNVTGLALGAYHTVICKSNGAAQAWGSNTYGQTTIPSGVANVVHVAAGYFHNLALTSSAQVFAWGYNNYFQTSVPADLPPVIKIACGTYHSVALTNAGHVVCWGAGSTDSSGGIQSGQSIVPTDLRNVVDIAGGSKHTVALLGNGLIQSWGSNIAGQGNSPAGYRAESIAAGNEFTIAIFNQSDQDADGVIGYLDNCPLTSNADQIDCDGDGYGDICGIALGVADDVDLNQVPDFCQYLYGDLNLDGVIDSSDLGGLLTVFGETGLNIRGDLNQDQVVDSSDMGAMLARYGLVP